MKKLYGFLIGHIGLSLYIQFHTLQTLDKYSQTNLRLLRSCTLTKNSTVKPKGDSYM